MVSNYWSALKAYIDIGLYEFECEQLYLSQLKISCPNLIIPIQNIVTQT